MTTPPAAGHPAAPGPEPHWVKSSASFSNSNCVQAARLPDGDIGVRHSRHPDGPVLRFTPTEWNAFVAGAANGEFSHLTAD
jgi:hypothetical protein